MFFRWRLIQAWQSQTLLNFNLNSLFIVTPKTFGEDRSFYLPKLLLMAQFQLCEQLPIPKLKVVITMGQTIALQIRGPAVKVEAKKAAYDVHDGRALGTERSTTGVDFSVLDVF